MRPEAPQDEEDLAEGGGHSLVAFREEPIRATPQFVLRGFGPVLLILMQLSYCQMFMVHSQRRFLEDLISLLLSPPEKGENRRP